MATKRIQWTEPTRTDRTAVCPACKQIADNNNPARFGAERWAEDHAIATGHTVLVTVTSIETVSFA